MTTPLQVHVAMQTVRMNAAALGITIESAGAKEYLANWLKNVPTVLRNPDGTFASPVGGSEGKKDKKSTGALSKLGADALDRLQTSFNAIAAVSKFEFTSAQYPEYVSLSTQIRKAMKSGEVDLASDLEGEAALYVLTHPAILKDAFNAYYRVCVEPVLREQGTGSIGAKLENLIDNTLRALKVLDKPMSDQIKDAAKERFSKEKIIQRAKEHAMVSVALAGAIAVVTAVCPAVGVPLAGALLTADAAAAAATASQVLEPLIGVFSDASLRFWGASDGKSEESKRMESAVSQALSLVWLHNRLRSITTAKRMTQLAARDAATAELLQRASEAAEKVAETTTGEALKSAAKMLGLSKTPSSMQELLSAYSQAMSKMRLAGNDSAVAMQELQNAFLQLQKLFNN